MIDFEAVDDTRYSFIDQRDMQVDEQAKALVGTPRRFKRIPASPAKRRVLAESGVDDLLGNGVIGYSSLLLFLAKAPRCKERNDGLRPSRDSGLRVMF